MKPLRILALGLAIAALTALALWRPQSTSAQEGPSPALSGEAPAPLPIAPAPTPSDRGRPRDGARSRVPGAELDIYVITFSPGEEPFFKFGHNAIWIHDPGRPLFTLSEDGRPRCARDCVYNYGTFSFEDPALIPKFFLGRFMYWLSTDNIARTKLLYQSVDRSVTSQELDLSPAQKLDMQEKLEKNVLDANKYYKYDYYRDNCSTRVRDMVDSALGGQLKAQLGDPGRMTYREHTLRVTGDLPYEAVGLNLLMGDFIDQPLDLWKESFLPMELQKNLRRVTIKGEDGTEHPLVKSEKLLVPTTKPPPRESPPNWWPWSLASGLVFGGLMAALGTLGKKRKPARVLYGVLIALLGLFFGFLGTFFCIAWAVTDHVVGYHNENIMQCAPWLIVLAGTGIRVATGRAKSTRFAEKLLNAAFAFAAVGAILKILPWFDQKNGFFLLFFLPLWAGSAWGIRMLREKVDADEKAAQSRTRSADAEPESREPESTEPEPVSKEEESKRLLESKKRSLKKSAKAVEKTTDAGTEAGEAAKAATLSKKEEDSESES